MSISINTNLASLQAQRYLGSNIAALQQNQERLSSGLRLNSAADDAAGVAISDRMTAQIRGMNQGVRNANDAIAMVQTAESGLQKMQDNLQAMREKAVQASNATYTSSDRQSLDDEYQELLGEIDRIAQEQSFNGQAILDGSRGLANFQIGPDTDSVDTIQVNMSSSMRTSAIGNRYQGTLGMNTATNQTTSNGGNMSLTWQASELQIGSVALDFNDVTGTNTAQGKVTTSAWGLAKAINNNGDLTVTASAQQVNVTAANTKITVTLTESVPGNTADGSYVLNINGQQVFAQALSVTGTTGASMTTATISAATIASNINNMIETIGVSASVTGGGSLKLFNTAGGNIKVDEQVILNNETMATLSVNGGGAGFFGTNTALTGITNTGTVNDGHLYQNYRGSVQLNGQSAFTVKDTGGGQEFTAGINAATGTYSVTTQGGPLSTSSVTSRSNAQTAINRIDWALSDMDTFRGDFGAAQNRFEATIANLQTTAQNLTDARSRIQDADIAKEAAEMSMNNVKQQAAASILTQANQNPQLALQLLGG